MCRSFGLPGAAAAVILLGLGLVLAGYGSLAREGRQPAWHHHLARPLAASLLMVPVCLILQRWHVMLAVFGGAVTYCVILVSLGGLAADKALAIGLPAPFCVGARALIFEGSIRRTKAPQVVRQEVADEVLHDHHVLRRS